MPPPSISWPASAGSSSTSCASSPLESGPAWPGCVTGTFACWRSQSSSWCSSVMACSMVSTVTKRQMWILRRCPGRRTRPTACISKATASSLVAASIGCTIITWLAAVKLVPLADSSRDSSSSLGPCSSYWNCVSAALRFQTLPLSVRLPSLNSSRAAATLRFRSSHCTKQMILQPLSSFCSLCTCRTMASIFDPYLANLRVGSCLVSTASTAPCCDACSVCWKLRAANSRAPS
mmetsp:Transcript_77355/g.201612  ORF Transcript_77355/g.201612 Transcript_77355/m.201612 type:complete len:234 (+) Transcript_77355:123-824(+)